MNEPSVSQEERDQALRIFDLSPSFSREDLERQYRNLLTEWHPHRYANLSNNPRKYMQLYRRGEAMTKEIHSAYNVLVRWLAQQEDGSTQA